MVTELRQLAVSYGRDEYNMLQTIKNGENGFYNPVDGMPYGEFSAWLKEEDDHSQGRNLPQGWIPVTTYFFYVAGVPVGSGRIRHRSSQELEAKGVGNLGYAIGKEHRGRGYGTLLLKKLLERCRSFGYNEIRLFPDINNLPTIKAMLSNGGEISGALAGKKHIIIIPVPGSTVI